MANKFHPGDPRQIWQNQPTEAVHMPVEELRGRAERRRRKARAQVLFSIVMGIALFVFGARIWLGAGDVLARAGWGVLSLWSLYFAWQAYHWTWPAAPGPDGETAASLDFYRRELERRRDYARHIWRRSGLTFCFLGLALLMVGGLRNALATPRLLVNMTPLLVLILVWVAAFVRLRKRNQRALQAEIDELDALATEGR